MKSDHDSELSFRRVLMIKISSRVVGTFALYVSLLFEVTQTSSADEIQSVSFMHDPLHQHHQRSSIMHAHRNQPI
jgi:hypothetical protein